MVASIRKTLMPSLLVKAEDAAGMAALFVLIFVGFSLPSLL